MAVRYDATGAGGSGQQSAGNTVTLTWTHTPVSNNNLAIVVGAVMGRSGVGTPTATYAGIPMLTLGSIDASGAGTVALFGILAPPAGAQTVVVSYLMPSAGGLAANSISYSGVASFGSIVTATSASLAITAPVDGMSTLVIGGSNSSVANFTNTTRYTGITNQTFVLYSMLGGDTATAGSTTYTWTAGTTRAVAVQLIPAMPFFGFMFT